MKQAAVVGLYGRTEGAESLAKKVEVSRPTLYAWKNEFLGAEAPATMRRKKRPLWIQRLQHWAVKVTPVPRDIREFQIEHDLLEIASELIKKDVGGDLQSLSNREKTMLIFALKNQYRVSALLTRLGLARSSYFYHRTRITLEDKYLPVRRIMAAILRKQLSLLRLPPAYSLSDTAFHHDIRESRAAFDEAGSFGRAKAQAAAL